MIILKIKVYKYKPEYFDGKDQLKSDIEQIFDFDIDGLSRWNKTYLQIWPIARTKYKLIKRRLVAKENEDFLFTYLHVTFWEDSKLQEAFYEKYIKPFVDKLKENEFTVIINKKEVLDDRIIGD
jgi:hypothetical protein